MNCTSFAKSTFCLIRTRRISFRTAHSLKRAAVLATILGAISFHTVRAETLQEYAAKCDLETGVSVPAFDCDDPKATEVPVSHPHFANPADPNSTMIACDRPNRLNQQCDPGSRFHVLVRTPDAFVVAHCRKKLASDHNGTGFYGDIAVIQHNTKTGATCFYQEGPRAGLSHNVVAPSAANGEWLDPAGVKSESCAECHDNGPIIRSPYLSQITGNNQLPGAGDFSFNSVGSPYYFVGSTFADWKSYRVIANVKNPATGQFEANTCNGCHRMGVSNVGNGGTSLDFGLRATRNMPETSQNPHSADSPLWMLLNEAAYDPAHEIHAQAIAACAARFKQHPNDPLPSGEDCRILPYTGVPDSPDHYAAIWTKAASGAFIARHGLTAAEYQTAFDQNLAAGYRLTSVDGYEVGGEARFAAIWRKQAGGAWIARHGLTSAQYQAEFDKNLADGYTLNLVNGYTVKGQDFYAAIWEKRVSPAWIARHNLTSAQYQAAFDANLAQGYRLELVSGYAVGAEARYAAIWRKEPSPPWAARHGLTSQQYQEAFDSFVGEGYHLVQVSGYKVGAQTLYAGIWEKSATPSWIARHGLPNAIYQEEFTALVSHGYTLATVSGY